MAQAYGYVRVSTQEQSQEGVSLDAQKAKIQSWCDLNNYELAGIFTDAGISGKCTDNRPGLQKALKSVGRGDALAIYSLSRMSRSTRDTLQIADTLERKGADLVSLSERIDTTSASGKMVFRMLAVLSEFERDLVSERTRTALSYKRAKGEKTGGNVPYGYDLKDSHLVENVQEQKVISYIHKLNVRSLSLRAICRDLESQGHRTKSGKRHWNVKTVSMILKRAA